MPAYEQPNTKATDPESNDSILEELRRRYDYATTQWQDILAEGDKDLRYICGETWDSDEEKTRKGRLTLKFDQLGQYLNQLVNAIRQNKRAVKVTPEGNGANDQTANLRANRIRQIEYLSNAPEVYTAAFSGAAERSFGYARIVAEWEKKSFTKTLRLKAIPNPNQCLPDPDDQSVTGRGWKYLFFKYPMLRSEFKRDYPDAKTGDYAVAKGMMGSLGVTTEWGDEMNVLVCEYWVVNTVTKKLVALQLADRSELNLYEDELQKRLADPAGAQQLAGAEFVDERDDEVPVVCSYLTNGIELLAKKGKPAKTEWKGTTIPFIGCYGKILYTNTDGVTKKIILSFIRLARDAQKYYNWIKSSEGEAIKLGVLASYMAYEGSLSDGGEALKASISTPVPVVFVKPTVEILGNQTPIPFPRREVPDPHIQGFEIAAEAARRDIQNALGRYSASVGRADTNVKSGVALEKLDKQSDQGSYHFVDNFDAFVREVGVKLDELIPFYDDTRKVVTTRKPNDEVEQVPINDPDDPDALDMTQGDHVVTISTGPDFDSEREVANAFADALVGNMDQIAKVIGPEAARELLGLSIKLKNIGPLGDSMVDIVSPQAKDGKPSPEQLAQQLQQMQGQLKQAEQVMQQMKAELDKEKDGNATTIQKAEIDAKRAVDVAQIQFASAANVADIKAGFDQSIVAMQAQIQAMQAMFGARQDALGREHEMATLTAEQQAAQQAQAADQAHAREMAEAGHAQALEAQQQAAALQPPPEAAP